MANVIAASDLGHLPSRDGLLPLTRGEFELPTKADPSRLGAFAPFLSPGLDQLPLKLGEATEDRQHQPAVRGCRVGPGVGQRSETSASLAYRVEDVEEIPGAAGEPIQPRDHLQRKTCQFKADWAGVERQVYT